MGLGPGIAPLAFWALKSVVYWALLWKKLPIGGVVYMALYGIESRRLLSITWGI